MFIIKYLKSLLYTFASLIILSIIISTFSYFNIISSNITSILELITIIISVFIGSLYLGKNSNKKGYLEGIKQGLIIIALLFLFNFLALDNNPSISNLLYYVIILITSILGSVLGINKKS